MINYISKPQLLPISNNNSSVHHFYEFQAKQMKEKQNQEINKLQQLRAKIQCEEKAKQKNYKNQPPQNKKFNQTLQNSNQKEQSRNSINNKSMFIKNKQDTTTSKGKKSFDQFYEKNKKWKQNLQRQILKKKQQKIQQQQLELVEFRKPLAQKSMMQSSLNNLQNKQVFSSLHHAFQSKGPITGWTQRFHQYIKKRLPQDFQESTYFKPTINKKSQIIASKMVGKVEDRLIKFGEVMKLRKHQMVLEQVQKIGKIPNCIKSNIGNNHWISTESDQSELFYRLYKQGEQTNRRNRQRLQKSEFSFRPSISKISEDMEKKVRQKRQKSPLYQSKKLSKQQTNRLLQMYKQQTPGKIYNESDFQLFLKRNQLLIKRRFKNLKQKQIQDLEKQEKTLRQCTFVPLLNPKSLKLFQQRQDNRIIPLEQQQNQQDQFYNQQNQQFQLEESPSLLFSKVDMKNGKGPVQSEINEGKFEIKSKYQYNHSYVESNIPSNNQEQYEYYMKTPASKSKQGNLQVSRNNDVSEMDSLQFSGQKSNITQIYQQNSRLTSNSKVQKGKGSKFDLKKSQNKHSKSANQNKVYDNEQQQGQEYKQLQGNQYRKREDQEINYELTFSNRKLAEQLNGINEDIDQNEEIAHQQIRIRRDTQINRQETEQVKKKFTNQHSMNKPHGEQSATKSWENQLDQVKNRLQKLMKKGNKNK